MRKRILSIVLALCMVLALMPQMAFAADPATNIPYLDASGVQQTCGSATVVTGDDTTWGDDGNNGWYVVNTNVTIGTEDNPQRVTVSGDVRLILADGCTLTVNGGIQVQDNSTESTPNTNALTIYGQSDPLLNEDGTLAENNRTGVLIANAVTNYDAAIGGNESNEGTSDISGSGGKITINSGVVKATGGTNGAAIGGGGQNRGGDGGTITINGGSVIATSINGVAIGGGYGSGDGGSGGKITITGGTVTANSYSGAAIGGGSGGACGGSGGEVTITGGTVKAGSSCGAGIGGGDGMKGGNGGKITITGGSVIATGNANGAGIGGGYGGGDGGSGGEVTITGGTVKAGSSLGAGIGGGNGDGGSGGNGTFETAGNGNAVIFASSIGDQSHKDDWSGIIVVGNKGEVYGSSVTPIEDFTIENGKTLTIHSGKTLIIPKGVTLTIADGGALNNYGTLYVDGTLSGTADGKEYYRLTVNGGTATPTYDYNSKIYATAGSQITLMPDVPTTGYEFKSWKVSGDNVAVNENTFTMPTATLEITAQFDPITYGITYELNGGTINSGNVTDYTYGQGATLPTDVTKAGYTFKGWYEDKNFTGSPVTAISDTETGEKTFYAKWAANSYYPISQTPTIQAGEGVKVTLSTDGKTATISVADGYEIADVVLNGVSLGKVTEVKNLKTGDKLVVTAEKKAAEPTKEEILAALADQQLTARSKLVTMKNGKKAVKITWYNKNGEIMDFDGVEIFRSTKKNSGYGNKPFYATKGSNTKGYYINTKDVKVGTTYYYRVRGYVIIDGKKYYTDYSFKAIRTVK